MELIRQAAAMAAWSGERLKEGRRLALVPTMGCLHPGHAALMARAAQLAELVVVSVFVNPMQFGPQEDFDRYPRALEQDCALASTGGAAALFAPEAGELYPPGFKTKVVVGGVSEGLCGASRPGHFKGVATVVAKLFNLVRPTVAVFGEKDFQQLTVIRALTRDLNFGIEIVGHPIVREADGLAMSSRNRYLSPPERRSALCLSRALREARQMVAAGLKDCQDILTRLEAQLVADPLVVIDYLAVVSGHDLAPQSRVGRDSVLLLAVRVGQTRLIDNGYLIRED